MKKSKIVSNKQSVGAGAAGVSVGTVLAVAFENLPDGSWKKLLVGSLPSISVGVSTVSLWCFSTAKSYWNSRQLEKERAAIQRIAAEQLDDKLTSEDHKKATKIQLEEFQRFELESHFSKYQSLRENHAEFPARRFDPQ